VKTMRAPIFVVTIPGIVCAAAFGGTYSVKDHGAKGDGVTNDEAAVKAASAAAPDGSQIYFPAGT